MLEIPGEVGEFDEYWRLVPCDELTWLDTLVNIIVTLLVCAELQLKRLKTNLT